MGHKRRSHGTDRTGGTRSTAAASDDSMDAPSDPAGDATAFSCEGVFNFRGREHTLRIERNGPLLVIEADDNATADQWKGELTAEYAEEITRRTGSFKAFDVLARMLQTAFQQKSDAVTIDLLSYEDLDAMRQNSGRRDTHDDRGRETNRQGKRYVILTYASEFDHIRYPFPLSYIGCSSPAELLAIVREQRGEIARLHALVSSVDAARLLVDSSGKGKRRSVASETTALGLATDHAILLREHALLKEAYAEVVTEKDALEDELARHRAEVLGGRDYDNEDGDSGDDASSRVDEQHDVDLLRKVLYRLEAEYRENRARNRVAVDKRDKEIASLAREVETLRSLERRAKIQLSNAHQELALLKATTPAIPSEHALQQQPRKRGAPNRSPQHSQTRQRERSREGQRCDCGCGKAPSMCLRYRRHHHPVKAQAAAGGAEGRPPRSRSNSQSRSNSASRGRSPSAGRFDPTEYVRKKEVERKRVEMERRGRSRERKDFGCGSSRGNSRDGSADSNAMRRRRQDSSVESLSGRYSKPSSRSSSVEGRSDGERRSGRSAGKKTDTGARGATNMPASSLPKGSRGGTSGRRSASSERFLKAAADITDIDARLDALHKFIRSAKV